MVKIKYAMSHLNTINDPGVKIERRPSNRIQLVGLEDEEEDIYS
jgi:hypothetical protein